MLPYFYYNYFKILLAKTIPAKANNIDTNIEEIMYITVCKLLSFCKLITSYENWENVVKPPKTPVRKKRLKYSVLFFVKIMKKPNKNEPNVFTKNVPN
jgi:hypothetical protein